MKLYILLILMCISNLAFATVWQSVKFTPDQLRLLEIAKAEGNKIGYPETIQAILLQESTAGLIGPVGDIVNGFGKRSYCHMQIKVAAAEHVISRYNLPKFRTEEELIAKLLTDDEFCIYMGAMYFKLMLEQTGDWKTAVLAYNKGVKGARRHIGKTSYVSDISNFITNVIRPLESRTRNSVPVYVFSEKETMSICDPEIFSFFTLTF